MSNLSSGIRILFKGNVLLQIAYFSMLFVSIWSTYAIYSIVLFCILSILSLPFKRYIDTISVFLFIFSILYCLFMFFSDSVVSWFNFISYLCCPTVFYIYGNWIVDKMRFPKNMILFWYISILLFSFVLYVSVVQDIVGNGFINVLRSFPIWRMDIEHGSLAATLYGVVASLGLVGLSVFFEKSNLSLSMRFLFLLLFVFSFMTIVHLVNRTGIFISCMSFLLVTFYSYRNVLIKWCLVLLGISFIIFLLFEFDVIDQTILDAYISRNIGADEKLATGGGRLERWIQAFQNLFLYPFGWNLDALQYGYAHNLWLDIARVSGLLPFIVFIIVTSISYVNLFRLLRIGDKQIVPLILGLNICFLLSSVVEPIIEALPLYFYLYVMLWGMQNRIYIILKQRICI